MRILVCVKRVPLTGGKMVLTADEQALETRHLGFTISPHEECGVEEAVRLVEAARRRGRRAHARAAARPRSSCATCLAIGADRGILLDRAARSGTRRRPPRRSSPPSRAERLRPDRLRQRVGRLRRLPGRHPRRVRARAPGRDRPEGPRRSRTARCAASRRWPAAATSTLVPLPAVVTVLEGINLPRYPSVPAKLRARQKPVETHPGARPEPRLERLRLVVPPGQGKQAEILGSGAGRGAGGGRGHARAGGGLMSVLVLVEPAASRRAVPAGARPRARARRAVERSRSAAGGGRLPVERRTWPTTSSTLTRRAPGRAAWRDHRARCRPSAVVAAGTSAATRCSRTSPRGSTCRSRPTAIARRDGERAVTRAALGRQPARGGAHPRLAGAADGRAARACRRPRRRRAARSSRSRPRWRGRPARAGQRARGRRPRRRLARRGEGRGQRRPRRRLGRGLRRSSRSWPACSTRRSAARAS